MWSEAMKQTTADGRQLRLTDVLSTILSTIVTIATVWPHDPSDAPP